MGDNSILQCALECAAAHYKVLRVDRETGTLAEPGGIKDATDDPEEIRKRFKGNKYNVAIATSSKLIAASMTTEELEPIEFAFNRSFEYFTGTKRHKIFVYKTDGSRRIKSKRNFRPGCNLSAENGFAIIPSSRSFEGNLPYELAEESLPLSKAADASADLLTIISNCFEEGPQFEELDEFTNSTPPREDFPINALSGVLREVVEAVAKAFNVSYSMAAPVVLSVLSTCFQRWCKVQPRRNDAFYLEELCFYFMTVAESGSRKTAVLNTLRAPVLNWQAEYNGIHAVEIQADADHRAQLQKRIEGEISRPANKGNAPHRSLRDLRQELADLDENSMRPAFLIATGNQTSESTTKTLHDNSEMLSLYSDEGSQVQMWCGGPYSKGAPPLVDIYLVGHDGSAYSEGRMTREGIQLSRPTLTICLFVQAITARQFIGDRVLSERGLAARFWFAFPENKRRTFDEPPLDAEIYNRYCAAVKILLDIRQNHIHDKHPVIITMSNEAETIFRAFQIEVEDERIEALPAWQSWLAKFAGETARLAALLQLFKNVTEGNPESIADDIEADTMQAAITIARFFKDEAAFAFDSYSREDSPEARAAQYLLKRLPKLIGDNDSIKVSALKNATRSKTYFDDVDDFPKALQVLVDRGYISIVSDDEPGKHRGRPSTGDIYINPLANIGNSNNSNE